MRISLSLLLIATTASLAQAFVTPHHASPSLAVVRPGKTAWRSLLVSSFSQKKEDVDSEKLSSSSSSLSSSWDKFSESVGPVATAAAVWVATAQVSIAEGPDWGIFEGRTLSLLHPIAMFSLLAYSLYTGWLGLQYRRQRTIGDDITALKKGLPDLRGASSVQEALDAAKGAGKDSFDATRVSALTAALETEKQIASLQQERKDLSKASPRDQHFTQGALLAFVGTLFAIEGPLNTYARAGKLFPGPHLYAGAGLVVAWHLAFACVPFMQRGSELARTIHVAANVAGLSLFAWQVVSGVPILLKVIENTSWP